MNTMKAELEKLIHTPSHILNIPLHHSLITSIQKKSMAVKQKEVIRIILVLGLDSGDAMSDHLPEMGGVARKIAVSKRFLDGPRSRAPRS